MVLRKAGHPLRFWETASTLSCCRFHPNGRMQWMPCHRSDSMPDMQCQWNRAMFQMQRQRSRQVLFVQRKRENNLLLLQQRGQVQWRNLPQLRWWVQGVQLLCFAGDSGVFNLFRIHPGHLFFLFRAYDCGLPQLQWVWLP